MKVGVMESVGLLAAEQDLQRDSQKKKIISDSWFVYM